MSTLTDFFSGESAPWRPAAIGQELYRRVLAQTVATGYPPLWMSCRTPIRKATVHHLLGIFALRKGPWKLILERGSGGFTQPGRPGVVEDAPQRKLYHLGRDPEEQNNLCADRPSLVDSFRSVLERYRGQGYSRPGFEPER